MQVVSTKVGGIPEVLPPDLIYLVEPTVPALIEGLETAIADYKKGNVECPFEIHRRIGLYYNWFNITKRTEIVYNLVKREAKRNLGQRLASQIQSGVLAYLLVVSLCYIILQILEFLVPRKVIKNQDHLICLLKKRMYSTNFNLFCFLTLHMRNFFSIIGLCI